MNWFDIVLRATAYPVWLVAAIVVMRVILHLTWSAASAYSLTLWAYRCCKVWGFAKTSLPAWMYMPSEFLRQWGKFIGTRPGQITVTHRGGKWRGIRRWSINPKDSGL